MKKFYCTKIALEYLKLRCGNKSSLSITVVGLDDLGGLFLPKRFYNCNFNLVIGLQSIIMCTSRGGANFGDTVPKYN